MTPVIYADLRALQDPQYQFRGIGNHLSGLLRGRASGPCAAWKLTGLVDDALGELPEQYLPLIDQVSRVWNASVSRPAAVFLDGSPMTHAAHLTTRFTSESRFVNAAVIYDFIPLDWPGYLPTTRKRIEYLSRLNRLRHFDLYAPISAYSASRLVEHTGVSKAKSVVTGCAVRSVFYARRKGASTNRSPYFFTLGGDDRRKNTEVAVAGVRSLNTILARQIPLKVAGHYGVAYKDDLLRLAGHEEGKGFLEFYPSLDDDALIELYRGALATICPSHIEGFDLPLVESAVCATPVIASTCGAHIELVPDTGSQFKPKDDRELAAKLAVFLESPRWREEVVRQQSHLANRFHEQAVARRFWDSLADCISTRTVNVRGRAKPRLAFITPYPPDRTGVARYSQLTIEAAARRADVDVYTNAPRPLLTPVRVQDAGRISAGPLLKGGYDSIISVLGNSDFHTPVFEVMEVFGGPCILHDSRLTHIYYHRMGHGPFVTFASTLLNRRVTNEEVELWLRDLELPSLFIEPVLEKASPLIVHTRRYQKLIRDRYGVAAEVAPMCPNMYFAEGELRNTQERAAARVRLGVMPGRFLISTFGFAGKEKGMDLAIIAIELLRGWKIPAELHFVGDTMGLSGEVRRIAALYGIEADVHTTESFVDERRYRDYMLGADAAVQLRNYDLGQASAALADCISAALPCVATTGLAESLEAPSYVRTVPPRSSPLHVAEQLASIWEERRSRASHLEEWRSYIDSHNFHSYAKTLCRILGLE